MAVRIIAVVSAFCLAGLATPSQANDSRVRYRCSAEGAQDISMSAKFEARGSSRKKFSVEFEAAPGVGFSDGEKLGVRVDGTSIGSVTLESIRGGDVVGDLNYDSNPDEADADPFPANFPKNVGKGTKVRLAKNGDKILACELR